MSEQFWLSFWKVVGVVLISVVLTAAGCSAHKTRVIAEAIKTSQNPVATACALGEAPGATTSGADIMCVKAVEK